jgi:hypothetical protein
MNVKIHIGRLVVEGEGASHSEAVRASKALRAHLSELVSRGISPNSSSAARLDAGVVPSRSMEAAGLQAAQQIFTHLGGGRRG